MKRPGESRAFSFQSIGAKDSTVVPIRPTGLFLYCLRLAALVISAVSILARIALFKKKRWGVFS